MHWAPWKGWRFVAPSASAQTETEALFNRLVAKIRSRGHLFWVLKHQLGYTKVRYRGLAKNTSQIMGLFALINLYIARR
jgi:IS5 family transposase